jgi:hypothetical protein
MRHLHSPKKNVPLSSSEMGSISVRPSRLALEEIGMDDGQIEDGCRTLIALEKQARSNGFALIASKAAQAAKA